MQFYEHSGRCGSWGVPLSAAVGAIAGIVLACAYAYVINWIPIVYVSFLATAGFGFAVGAATAWGAKVGHMRNMMIATAVAALMGLVALYFAWAFDPMARFPQQIGTPLWKIEHIFEYMKFGYSEGFWSIGRNGSPVTGIMLAIVWVAEAALIVGLAGYAVRRLLGEQPYCEETAQWTTTQKKVARLSLVDDADYEAKLNQLLAGNLNAVTQFYRADGSDPALLQLDLATCPDCPTCNYLTVKMIQHVVNKKGETTKQENKLLVNLRIAPEDVDLIRSAGQDRPPQTELESETERLDTDESPQQPAAPS